MSAKFTAACIQPDTGTEIAANLDWLAEQVRAARAAGADFIATPEVSNFREAKRKLMFEKAETEADSASLETFRELAVETGAWLLAGSLAIRLDDGARDARDARDDRDGRVANRSYLIGPDGSTAATYDKIHMFDVDLAGGEWYRESDSFRPGEAAVLAATPWGRLGMTVCYDLRFPHLYRDLAKAGAEMLTIPANFTHTTGKAHWHVLLRARAIECGAFVIAPAQCGTHPGKHPTYGHSLIVDPWGEVLADAGPEPGFVSAEIDMAKVAKARAAISTLTQDRPYAAVPPAAGAEAAE